MPCTAQLVSESKEQSIQAQHLLAEILTGKQTCQHRWNIVEACLNIALEGDLALFEP